MTILITGATSGIGRATAELLGASGHDIALVGRTAESAEAAADAIRSRATGRVTAFGADLASREQVAALADAVEREHPRLAALVLCAAVANPLHPVTDGLDTTLAVNHLAPASLARRLDVSLAGGRIVLVGSSQHAAAGPFEPGVFAIGGTASGSRRYEATKLLNLLFAAGRSRHPHLTPLEVIDPGFVRTALGRNARGAFRVLLTVTRPLQSPPEVPAGLIAERLASADFADGAFQGAKGPARTAANARDADAVARAWDWTQQLLG